LNCPFFNIALNDTVKMSGYEVDGVRPRSWPKKAWIEIVVKDCWMHRLVSRRMLWNVV